MLGCAPGRVQARLPAASPRVSAASKSTPEASAAAKAPTNVSPAAVVSTGTIFGAGFSNTPDGTTFTSTLSNAGDAFFGGTVTASNLVLLGPSSFTGTLTTRNLSNAYDLWSSNLTTTGSGIFLP